jgi:phage replication-related protein YjqB (UPF0714/DUF867 family)
MNKRLTILIFLFLPLFLYAKENNGYAYLTKVRESQEILLNFSAEDCSLDHKNPLLPEELHDGDQVRVHRHDNKDFVLFTVHFIDEGKFGKEKIRMTEVGMSRLGYDMAENQKLKLSLPAVLENMTEQKAKKSGELYEFVVHNGVDADNADFLFVLTPHGGEIEDWTDAIGRQVVASEALKNVSILWGCAGFDCPKNTNPTSAYNRWHITSTAVSENSFPKLQQLMSKDRMFEHAISFHGYRGDEILIGGRGALAIKILLKEEIAKMGVKIPAIAVESSGYLSGFKLSNIVNRYSNNGIQIEFPFVARDLYAKQISDAVVRIYAKLKQMEKSKEFLELEMVDSLNAR